MDKTYTTYNSSNINSLRLDKEIRVSGMEGFTGLTASPESLIIHFSVETVDEAKLVALLLVHNPNYVEPVTTIIPKVEINKIPDPSPFATPTYRTKWDASSDVVVAQENETVTMDYTMTEERYVHGGSIVFDGVEVGDKLEAMIVDSNGVIPAPYRSFVAENYPVVATYIYKHYLPPGEGVKELNTYPLTAKITPGLVLRVVIHTCSTVGTRRFATNYLLTKKL